MSTDTANIREVYEMLGRMEEKLDKRLGSIDQKVASIDNRLIAVETKAQANAAWAGAVISVLVNVLFFIANYLMKSSGH